MDKKNLCVICCIRRSEELIISFIAAAVTGILSAWGIGGGTLLIVFMTVIQGLAASEARGINLLYFLPTSSAALYSHIKNGFIHKKATVFAVVPGLLTAAAVSFFSKSIAPELIKKLFGAFLIFIGIREFFRKSVPSE